MPGITFTLTGKVKSCATPPSLMVVPSVVKPLNNHGRTKARLNTQFRECLIPLTDSKLKLVTVGDPGFFPA